MMIKNYLLNKYNIILRCLKEGINKIFLEIVGFTLEYKTLQNLVYEVIVKLVSEIRNKLDSYNYISELE